MLKIDYDKYNSLGLKNAQFCAYTYLHRRAFLWFVENNKYLVDSDRAALVDRARLHDLDKMLNYTRISKDLASEIHRKTSPHHTLEGKKADRINLLESIFDYECAAITKPDKPLNAFDTVNKHYSDLIDLYLPELEKLHMNSSYVAIYPELEEYMNKYIDMEKRDIIDELLFYTRYLHDEVLLL